MTTKKKEDVLINVLLLSLGIFYVGVVFVFLLGNIFIYSYSSMQTTSETMIKSSCQLGYDAEKNSTIEERFILSYDPLSRKAILQGFLLTPSLGYHSHFKSLTNTSNDVLYETTLTLAPSDELKTDTIGAIEVKQGLLIPEGKEKIHIKIQKDFDTGPKDIECLLPKLTPLETSQMPDASEMFEENKNKD